MSGINDTLALYDLRTNTGVANAPVRRSTVHGGDGGNGGNGGNGGTVISGRREKRLWMCSYPVDSGSSDRTVTGGAGGTGGNGGAGGDVSSRSLTVTTENVSPDPGAAPAEDDSTQVFAGTDRPVMEKRIANMTGGDGGAGGNGGHGGDVSARLRFARLSRESSKEEIPDIASNETFGDTNENGSDSTESRTDVTEAEVSTSWT